ncbi:unnamed protein product [Chironomus riparius]|uniref:Uncharacterized protein n=1 Tax=Chironomus riparius TaxID=315576 RepID=A0A9N9WU31_9DIPT|nr:unnamed protein product [Chironomus riparius]
MNKKLLFTIFVILIYGALFFLYANISKRSYECGFGSPCIRFCSSDTNEYSDESLLKQFKESKSSNRMIRSNSLKVIRGAPACGKLKYWPPNMEVNSTDPPYKFDYYGDVQAFGDDYSVSRYCLEKDEDVFDGWKLMTCYQDYYLQKGFHVLTIFLSVTLLGFTLFLYCYKYRQIKHVLYSLFAVSLVMILLWITVLIVHTYLTFRNFKIQTSIPHEFSTYAIFVLSFSMFSAFVFIQDTIYHGGGVEYLFFIYIIIASIDIFLLIVTGVKMLITSRHLEHSEQARFDNEKKWYWIINKVTLMMLVTWLFESLLWFRSFNVYSETIGDFVNLLTATAIMLMLVGREKARILLFGKYREVYDVENDAD